MSMCPGIDVFAMRGSDGYGDGEEEEEETTDIEELSSQRS